MELHIAAFLPSPNYRWGATVPAANPRRVIAFVAEAHGLCYEDIVGPSRVGRIVKARFEAASRLRHMPWRKSHPSYPQIARWLGYRDHTSAINAVRRHDNGRA